MIATLAIALAACGPAGDPDAADQGAPAEQTDAKPENGIEQHWVTTERLDRRTCPSRRCGVVGQLMFRDAARVYETTDGWARISEPYDASCVAGRSEYVDSGQASCTEANGISGGRFAEWVEVGALSTTRPADPAATAATDETLVAQSDDFQRHRRAFAQAAAQLIADGRCTRQDFIEMGGWLKSVNEYRDQPVYFTYCGGMTQAHKIYLDASTGRIFR